MTSAIARTSASTLAGKNPARDNGVVAIAGQMDARRAAACGAQASTPVVEARVAKVRRVAQPKRKLVVQSVPTMMASIEVQCLAANRTPNILFEDQLHVPTPARLNRRTPVSLCLVLPRGDQP